jgi:hypothetical protein
VPIFWAASVNEAMPIKREGHMLLGLTAKLTRPRAAAKAWGAGVVPC